ncbi:MAG: S8 family serine peptidase, partial [Anaerolineae bacterium]|nr:S8 family serine peptidase [Anaerolineae bacterium]
PAACDNVFAVSATTQLDARAPYSNYGAHNDIAAPGGSMSYLGHTTGIYSTMPTYGVYMTTQQGYLTTYDYLQGTSQAAPFVSGLAALIWSLSPGLTPDQVQQRINAREAVESLLALTAPVLSPIDNPDFDGTYWVDWSDLLYATSYTLEEADTSQFTSPTIRFSGSTSTALVTGRPRGLYYYRVRGEHAGAGIVSPWSNIVSVQAGPSAPVLLPIVNDGANDYPITWQATAGATGYRLQESSDIAFTAPITRYVGTNTSFTVTGQPGGTWHYRVQAYNSAGSSDWSTVQSTTVRPAAPTLNPIALTPPDAYTLTWSTATGATGYRLEQSADLSFTMPVTRFLGVSTSYAITGQPGGTWHYRVQAYNQAGSGPASNTRTVTVTASLVPTPVLHPINYNSGPAHYTVSWTAVPTATYTLEESRSIYFETPAIAYTGALTSYVAMGQAPGPWHYRVRAHTAAGSSTWSNVRTVPAFVYLPIVVRDSPSR